jgi:hypothetical protein
MADNYIRLSYSDDGGQNFSNWDDRTIGEQGQYQTRAVWTRLGSFENRVLKFRITTPRRCDILGAVAVLQGTEG